MILMTENVNAHKIFCTRLLMFKKGMKWYT
jgi:hypothetical protein